MTLKLEGLKNLLIKFYEVNQKLNSSKMQIKI